MITISLFYCYKTVNIWIVGNNFNKTSLPEKEDYYSHSRMRDVNNKDYSHSKRFYKDFEIINSREYNDLYAQSDSLLLTDVFPNFLNMCIRIYDLHPAKFLSASGLTWQAASKKGKNEIRLFN